MLFCLLVCCLGVGCGGGGDEEQSESVETTPTEFVIKTVDPSSLPVGNTLPHGVSDRVRVSGPKEWFVPGRQSGYVAWFLRWESSQIPLIFLKEDATTFDAEQINAENIQAYAQSIAKRLAEKETEPLEEILVLKFGDQYFVRYVVEGRVSGTYVERQVLETQAKGKTYLIELRVLPGKLVEYRDAGYAVAASLRFIEKPPEQTQ